MNTLFTNVVVLTPTAFGCSHFESLAFEFSYHYLILCQVLLYHFVFYNLNLALRKSFVMFWLTCLGGTYTQIRQVTAVLGDR